MRRSWDWWWGFIPAVLGMCAGLLVARLVLTPFAPTDDVRQSYIMKAGGKEFTVYKFPIYPLPKPPSESVPAPGDNPGTMEHVQPFDLPEE